MLEQRLSWLILTASVAVSAGCSQELGPEIFPTTRVVGKVTIPGRSIASGWIEFSPVQGTKGNLRSAPIRADGSYSADGVPVGRVFVTLINLQAQSPAKDVVRVPVGYYRFSDNPIPRDIPPGEMTRLDFDLAAEAAAYNLRRIELERLQNDRSE